MEGALLWLALAAAVGAVAHSRRRSGPLWFVAAVALSPLVAVIILLLMPRKGAVLMGPDGRPITPDTHVRCPECRELVLRDARRCKHCGIALVPQSPDS